MKCKVIGTEFWTDERGWLHKIDCTNAQSGWNNPEDLVQLETLITLRKILKILKGGVK